MAKMLKFPSFNTDFHVVPSEQLFESVITSTTKISCDFKERIQVDSVSQLLYDYFNTVCSINFFSFGVLFKCIPWQTLAKILFESLVHCEYKNTKPNIEIKQSKLMYSVSNSLLRMMPWWMNARTESVLFGSFISLAFTHCDASFRPPFFISPNDLLLMSEKKSQKSLFLMTSIMKSRVTTHSSRRQQYWMVAKVDCA